jgi:hypothetical protein
LYFFGGFLEYFIDFCYPDHALHSIAFSSLPGKAGGFIRFNKHKHGIVFIPSLAIIIRNKDILTIQPSIKGDLIAIGASCLWAIYQCLNEKIGDIGIDPIAAQTRVYL